MTLFGSTKKKPNYPSIILQVFAIIASSLLILAMLFPDFHLFKGRFFNFSMVAIAYSFLYAAFAAYRYIESGNSRQNEIADLNIKLESQIHELQHNFSANFLKSEGSNLNTNDLDGIIKEKIKYSLDYTLKDYFESKYGHTIFKSNQLNQVNNHINELQIGVNNQIGRLSRSGTINLLIGVGTSLSAIVILLYLVFSAHKDSFDSTKDFLIYLIPRLSLVIFIEIFSFFFLKLYKTNLEDVKYFYNERTNIDSKVIALKTSQALETDATLIEIIKEFSKVERNFILKKNESTVNIERIKLDNKHDVDIISKITDIIEKAKK